MKKVTIILVAILFIFLIIAFKDKFFINIPPRNSNPNNVISPTQSNSSLETKDNSEGTVSVVVTPQNINNDSSTLDFEIVLNTHSEELNNDLVAVSELVDDQGNSYRPISWKGDNSGGHHRSGILKFNPILPKPKFIELKIKNIGNVSERSFKWNL